MHSFTPLQILALGSKEKMQEGRLGVNLFLSFEVMKSVFATQQGPMGQS